MSETIKPAAGQVWERKYAAADRRTIRRPCADGCEECWRDSEGAHVDVSGTMRRFVGWAPGYGPQAPTEAPAAPSIRDLIAAECDALKAMLLEKNAKYGNSALDPARIFSKASPVEQILVRIDDKLSRIRTSGEDGPDEDTVRDLMGYLVLLRVARKDALRAIREGRG